MLRRLAVTAAALTAVIALSSGLATAASAQTTPGTVTADLQCGPLTSDLTVNLTSGTPDTSYTIGLDILGIRFGTTMQTDAAGDAVATLGIPTALLDTVTELLPQVVADGETPVIAPAAQVCGILGGLAGSSLPSLTGSPAGLPL